MKKSGRQKKKKFQKSRQPKAVAPRKEEHKQRFDQLVDDAIFGIKKS